ncbi:hypothetical protein S40288_00506 [Stachybotrys chartarum IBT 40288]|nr:hypothetical protein S40288_00506 [Stachybotrys chartarum IBT 40288]
MLRLNSVYLLGFPIALALLHHIIQVQRKASSRVPGPWYTKWTGLVGSYYVLKGKHAYYIHGLHQKYGPMVRIAPDQIAVCDLAAVKEIYHVKETYTKSPWYSNVASTKEPNIFNTHHVDIHRRHRKLLSGPMSETSLSTLMPVIQGKVDLAIQRMKEEMEARGAADVLKWCLFMATDVVGTLTFGDSFRLLELGKKNEYVKDLEAVGPMAALRGTFPTLVSYTSRLPLPMFERFHRATHNLRRYAEESLRVHENLVRSDSTRIQRSLFTGIFKAQSEEKLTFPEVRSNAQAYIIAGSDTTSNTLTYLIWTVCKNPDIKKKLVEELRTLPDKYEYTHLRSLPYLHQVVQEVLRLYSAAPSMLPRIVPPEGASFCGYSLEPGTTVATQAYTMHRDPVIFPDPERFDPERWAEPSKAMKDAFMAFGRGSRVCIGLHLANTEIRLMVARFFLEFPEAKVSQLEGMSDEDMVAKMYFLLVPSGQRCLIEA